MRVQCTGYVRDAIYSQGFLSEPIFAMQLFPLWLNLLGDFRN